MQIKPTIVLVLVLLASSTLMPMKGREHTRQLPILDSQESNSGANIFEAYDATKSEKQMFERLDGLALYLKENPTVRAYIISYGGRRSCWEEALDRARFASDYLSKNKRIDRKRITAFDGGYLDQWSVYLWVGAQGEAPPAPTPTVDRDKVQIIKNCKRKIPRHKKSPCLRSDPVSPR